MTFDEIIQYQNRIGFSYHVFQLYGPKARDGVGARGFSMSFHRLNLALKYAASVPEGVVYDSQGNEVNT